MLPIDPARYALFAGVMAVFAVTPGPANLFAIATGMRAGPRAALLGVAGMNAATLVWFGAAAFGLGALVAAFPAQFHLIAIVGGLYVAWLGLASLWKAYKGAPPLKPSGEARRASAFRAGFAVQLSNPKAMVFFTAVLPPFIDPARPLTPQLALLGATMIAMDVASMSLYGLAGGVFAAINADARAARIFSAFVGVLLLIASALILLRD
ncbi:MAG: LysE family translocator [Proteobacteria bacterium]|nr:LysE family translocator [Pseudomonadota bacterium]